MEVRLSLDTTYIMEGEDWSYYSNIDLHNCPFLKTLVD